jgi:hypothetical protein
MRACLLWLLAGCACSTAPPRPLTALSSLPEASAPEPVECGALPREIGRLGDTELNEISGVVESRKDPRVLFVHNDSGDSPRFFAIDRRGQVLVELVLEQLPLLLDAEEIAIGPGPGGGSFVYLGDTGNNFASMGLGIPRRKAVIYRIPEPEVPVAARQLKVVVQEVFPIVFTFPKGAQDVEAFFVDPRSGDLVMIAKQGDGRSQVLGATAATLAAGGGELVWLGELRFGQPPLPGNPMPTAASISRDGSAILVRTYSSVFLFARAVGESVQSALSRPPRELPAPRETQGEAISFVDEDGAFLTISEGVKPAINCARIVP